MRVDARAIQRAQRFALVIILAFTIGVCFGIWLTQRADGMNRTAYLNEVYYYEKEPRTYSSAPATAASFITPTRPPR